MIGLGLRWPKSRKDDGGPQQASLADAPGLSRSESTAETAPAVQTAAAALQDVPSPTEAEAPETAALSGDEAKPEHAANDSGSTQAAEQTASSPAETQPEPVSPAAEPAPERTDLQELKVRLQSSLGTRFLVQKPIAIGGMATIFLLQHQLHGGLFVAKVLHTDLAAKPGVAEGFRLEATHAAQLGNHPNAVPVFDCVEGEDLFYLLMPYIEGADLDRVLLKAGPLSRDETLQIAAQVSSLLCHAESLGIVHGDLSPGNIRLDIYGQYRLLDLGLSQQRGPQDRPYSAGTPLYNSPEQIAGEPMDIRSDLYSLGVVLCECLSNRPAFHADTLAAIHERHRAGNWQMPETLDETDPLRRLLTMLLRVNPAERPQSAYELSGILHALGWARPEFRPTPPGLDPFMRAPGSAPRKRLSD